MYYVSFPGDTSGKDPPVNAGDSVDFASIPGSGRSPGGEGGNPLQYPGLENSMNCILHGGMKSGTRLSDFHFYLFGYQYYQFHDLS